MPGAMNWTRVTPGTISRRPSNARLNATRNSRLETAGPPTFYLPPDDVLRELLVRAEGGSHCEWKGLATYWSLRVGDALVEHTAWSYTEPYAGFERLRDHVSFLHGYAR